MAFLPISNTHTSIVYSILGKKDYDIKGLINSYNKIYSINKFNEFKSFELKSSNLRNYYHCNILAFGDLLHKVHPLAGQGFNMTMRDIKELVSIINLKLNIGLSLDFQFVLILKKLNIRITCFLIIDLHMNFFI